MLYLNEAPDIRPLVRSLAELLVDPLEDPMAREWVAVPTSGMQRWTKLQLARSLGSSPDREDGISANIDFNFPGKLRQLVIDASHPGSDGEASDPWHIDRLVWTVLEVLEESAHGIQSPIMPDLPEGASPYGRARRIADLFDRYSLHRPELIEHWRSGRDVDPTGTALAAELSWQPELWRRVRSRIGVASPSERLGPLLERLRVGDLDLDLPPRVSIFGITSLPGGSGFLELVGAIAVERDVHCYFLELSPDAARRVATGPEMGAGNPSLLRSRDRSEELLHHPLLMSWGSPVRERAAIFALAGHGRESLAIQELEERSGSGGLRSQGTLLARIQSDLREDRAPDGAFEMAPDDWSIQIHGCYGPARQVEVLRDSILHLLQDDPDLEEEEIVVLCPSIEDFAPFVEAGFGLPISMARLEEPQLPGSHGMTAPTFSYHMSDRSLRTTNPLLQAFDAFLDLVGSRCGASEVLEFIALDPVSRRFSLHEDAVQKIVRWTRAGNVRWGLSAAHRVAMGFGEQYELNTWRAALENLLIGVATHDFEFGLAAGEVAPIGVEGDEIEIVGQFAELLDRLEVFVERFSQARTPRQWCEEFERAGRDLFEVDPSQTWQSEALRRLLANIAESAICRGSECLVEVTLADMRRAIAENLLGAPGRSEFFRGGVTVTSLTPLRWIPFKVVCLLGLDDAISRNTQSNGDDVMALAPQLGDPDARSEMHQSILEAILSARAQLVVTYNSHDPQTNLPVPRSVELLELEETIVQTLTPTSQSFYRQNREVVHPRQSYDDRNFESGRLGHEGPWSFNASALAGASARRTQDDRPRLLLGHPIEIPQDEHDLPLDALREFLRHPVRSFLRKSLQIYRPFDQIESSDELPVALEPIEHFEIGRRLLAARLELPDARAWRELRDSWWAREHARGSLPVGQFAQVARRKVEDEVDALIEVLVELGIDPSRTDEKTMALRVEVEEMSSKARGVAGSLIVGDHKCRNGSTWRGSWSARFSRLRPVDELAAWLDLLVLTLHAPSTHWTSLSLRRVPVGDQGIGVVSLAVAGESETARLENARIGLAAIVRLAELGRNEPLPLFAGLSKTLYYGTPDESDWVSTRESYFTDGTDPDNVLAFGNIKLTDLLQIPARSSDPGVGQGRATRLARFLWGTFDNTCIRDVLETPERILAK